MAAIIIKAFDGLKPVMSPLLLGAADATVATDVELSSGSVRPMRGTTVLKPLTKSLPKTIFRYGNSSNEAEHWLEFTAETDVMRSVAVEDPYARVYWTDGIKPKYAPSSLILSGSSYPGASYDLGIPAPASAPTVAGSAPTVASLGETRAYLITYVTAYGEEGPPSVASSLATVDPSLPVFLTAIPGAPSGNYNITLKRIYRSSAIGSAAQWQYVSEIPVGQTTLTDEVKQDALGEILLTEGWTGPPAALRGLKMMASGVAVGFSGNTIYASEAGLPYAWPHKFPVDSQVVGIGVFRQNVVALTNDYPFLLTITDPAAVVPERIELPQACVSKASIVDTGDGVLYASPDGIVSIGSGGAVVLTLGHMSHDQWRAYNPASMKAFWHEGAYHAFFTRQSGERGLLIWDASGTGGKLRESTLSAAAEVTAGFTDTRTDTLYLAQSGSIVRFNRGAALTGVWRSKTFRLAYPANMAAACVDADAYPLTLRIYADGALFHTRVVTSREPFRLPGGPRSLDWELEVEAQSEVTRLRMASSMQELKAAQ